jgi:hypothetical protein
MFSQVDVSIKGQKITSSVDTYPYRAFFETLLNYGNDAQESHLTTSLFYKDTPGKMESIAVKEPDANQGWLKRRNLTKDGEFELFGRIHADIFCWVVYIFRFIWLTSIILQARELFK